MTVRTVIVRLGATAAGYTSTMRGAARTAARTSASIRTSMNSAATRTGRTMNTIAQRGEKSLGAMRTASLGLIAVFGAAVYASAKFEHAMSGVQAVTQASAKDMAVLREVALEAGRTTRYSATEAAQGMEELAKAGISVADISGGALKGALNLAAAAQIDLTEASEIAATSMVVFGLKGRDVGHIADVLAAAANKSATDVHQLGLSMRMAGQVSSQTGLSLEDTTGALALFAAEGLKGSDAGTSFKVMLQRLTPQSKEAEGMMDQLGFSAYDASGQFIGLEGVAREMQQSFGALTPEARNSAMALIFGSDAVRAATILYKNGAAGVNEFVAAVDDQGYAAAVAATRMDNLVGDLEYLKSALESALIQSGTAANNTLRDMTQWVTRVVNAYNQLPKPLQESTVLLAGIVGVVGLVGASMLLMVPRIVLARRELATLGWTAGRTRGLMMGLAKGGAILAGLAVIGWGVGRLTERFREGPPKVEAMTESLVKFARDGRAAGEVARTFGGDLDGIGDAVARITAPSNMERVDDIMNTWSFGMTEALAPAELSLDTAQESLRALDDALAGLIASGAGDEARDMFQAAADSTDRSGQSIEDLRGQLPKYHEAMAAANVQTELSADSQATLSDSLGITKDQLEETRSQAEQLADALSALNGVAISAAEAEIGFEGSLDSLTTAIGENGRSLDINKESGRENKSAILDAISAAQAHAEAVTEQTGSIEDGTAAFDAHIARLRGTLREAGFTEDQIRDLTSEFARLPSEVAIDVGAPGAAHAIEQMQTLYEELDGLPDGHHIDVDAPTDDVIAALEEVGYSVEHINDRTVRITAPTENAQASVRGLAATIDALRDRTVTVTQRAVWTDSRGHAQQQARAGGGRVQRLAAGGMPEGGWVSGPGSSTSDSIPAWLSDGEYVIRAAAVNRYGLGMLNRINGMRYAAGGKVGKGKKPRPDPEVVEARRSVPGDLRSFTASVNDSAEEISAAARDLREDLRELGKTGNRLADANQVTANKLMALARQRTAVSERISEARDYARDQRGAVSDSLALSDTARTPAALIAAQKRQVGEARQFKRDIARLQKRGLRDDLLEQVISQGPDGQLAKVLAMASANDIKQLNALARTGANLATGIGRDAADAMFDAGANAGKGFLAGLKSEEAALEKQMSRIAEAAVNTIKKKLKINSPSQVTRQLARQTGDGYRLGLDDSIVGVRAAARRVSGASMVPLSGQRFAGAGMGRQGVADLVRSITTQVSSSTSGGGTSYTIHARTADFTLRDLERVQRVQDARARLGRPR